MKSAAAARMSARVRRFFFSRREVNISNVGQYARQYGTVAGRPQRIVRHALAVIGFATAWSSYAEVTAQSLIEGALDLTRGTSSYTELTMTIHRPAWQRTLSLTAWTRGREDALIRFTAPPKDAGTATLKKGEQMWTYSPKIRREVRLPSSMMSQQWAGSDFSYNDLSRSDKYLRYYDFEIVQTEQRDGHAVYTLDMVPRDDAPVVWGKETLVLRDDYVTLSQTFYDQELEPVKRMVTLSVGTLGGRTFALAMRMQSVDKADSWTEVRYVAADFDATVDDSLFTTFALRGR